MTFWEAFFANLPAFLTALASFVVTMRNRKSVEEIRHQTNSLVEQLGREASERGRRLGVAEGRTAERLDPGGSGHFPSRN